MLDETTDKSGLAYLVHIIRKAAAGVGVSSRSRKAAAADKSEAAAAGRIIRSSSSSRGQQQ
jgi:hypothetical protein